MELKIRIENVKPISLNHYQKISNRGKFTTKYKPVISKQFDLKVKSQLSKFSNEIQKFNSLYNRNKHYLMAEYRFYFPILTKGNLVNLKSGDVDNLIKPIQDLIFKNLICDDAEIISTSAIKINSKEPFVVAVYTVRDLTSIL